MGKAHETVPRHTRVRDTGAPPTQLRKCCSETFFWVPVSRGVPLYLCVISHGFSVITAAVAPSKQCWRSVGVMATISYGVLIA